MKRFSLFLSIILMISVVSLPVGWCQEEATSTPETSQNQDSSLGGGIDEADPPPQKVALTNPATIVPILVFLVIFGALYWFIRQQPTSDEIKKKRKRKRR